MKHWQPILIMFASLCVSLALADDFKTIYGKEYKNAKVSRVEPDGIVLLTKSGISKVYFTELPKEVQERFHYDAQQAAQFTSQTVEQDRLARERKVEEDEKRAEEVAKRKAEQEVLRQQQDAEMRRQQWEAEQQGQQRDTEQHQQVEIQRAPASLRISGGDTGAHLRNYTGSYNFSWRFARPPSTRRAVSRKNSR